MAMTKQIIQNAPPSELLVELILGKSRIDFCTLMNIFPRWLRKTNLTDMQSPACISFRYSGRKIDEFFQMLKGGPGITGGLSCPNGTAVAP